MAAHYRPPTPPVIRRARWSVDFRHEALYRTSMLEVRSLRKRFGQKVAIDGVSFTVGAGEFVMGRLELGSGVVAMRYEPKR